MMETMKKMNVQTVCCRFYLYFITWDKRDKKQMREREWKRKSTLIHQLTRLELMQGIYLSKREYCSSRSSDYLIMIRLIIVIIIMEIVIVIIVIG